uniref:Group-specific protein n=1 Tax=Strongyloides papillosus TaxID=174720 RepID=A0A0N5C2R3_STREA
MESNQKLFEEHLNENQPMEEEDFEPYPSTTE